MPTSDLEQDKIRREQELIIQRQIAFASGLFQGDVTVRTLLESLAEGVVIIDSLGTILLVNHRAEQMFGYSKEEIIGKPHALILPERFNKAHEEHVAHFFAEPKIRPMGQGMELAGRRKDGSEFPVEISLSFLETINGHLALAFISDITRRKEAEQSLKDRNQELDAFAHTVAHDMKDALNVLMLHGQVLDMTAKDISHQLIQDSIARILKSGMKLNQIIDGLLLLSSVTKEKAPSVVVEMPKLIAEVVERLSILIDDRKAKIMQPDHFPTALGYGPWVEEIWFNYISNAIKYGGIPPIIQLGATLREDGYIDFWVQDNGQCMTDEEQTGIFDYNHRPSKKSADGYGLGLSIVKRIAEKLNGQVSVINSVEGGCIFTFSLPLAEESTGTG